MKYSAKLSAVSVTILLFSPGFLMAAGKTKSNPLMEWCLNNILVIIAAALIIGVLASLWNVMDAILLDKKREFRKAHGMEPDPVKVPQETFLARWYNMASGLVPLEKEADLQLDHDYDGIKELDNSLPPWWLYGFYLSILVAVGYLYVYHYSDIGLSQHEEYELAMEEGEKQKALYASLQTNKIDEKNLVALTDGESLEIGMKVFIKECATCHGEAGQGGVGPNLTDRYWLHGGSTRDIYKTIKNGVPEKGMISWKSQFPPSTMHKIASYISSLEGTNPPNPKAKQGDLYEPEEVAVENN